MNWCWTLTLKNYFLVYHVQSAVKNLTKIGQPIRVSVHSSCLKWAVPAVGGPRQESATNHGFTTQLQHENTLRVLCNIILERRQRIKNESMSFQLT